jgi:hypothetical protein
MRWSHSDPDIVRKDVGFDPRESRHDRMPSDEPRYSALSEDRLDPAQPLSVKLALAYQRETAKYIASSAYFSPGRDYRYTLERRWDDRLETCLFIMLNPSIADDRRLDPTVTRCVKYAQAWGYGALQVVNLFALVSTDPRALRRRAFPVGPENDEAIQRAVQDVRLVVAAWGNHGTYLDRHKEVLEMLSQRDLHCLGTTKEGHPRHPLYLRKDVKPSRYPQIGDSAERCRPSDHRSGARRAGRWKPTSTS